MVPSNFDEHRMKHNAQQKLKKQTTNIINGKKLMCLDGSHKIGRAGNNKEKEAKMCFANKKKRLFEIVR